MVSLALTGNIGSGKSTVAHFFQQQGVTIIDADAIAHQHTQPHSPTVHAIASHFGPSYCNDQGILNRDKLRKRIFTDPVAKEWLEQQLHPLIYATMAKRIHEFHCNHAAQRSYCMLVIPLLVEKKPIHFIRNNTNSSH